MDTPPSVTVSVQPSRGYVVLTCMAALFAIFFIAYYVTNKMAESLFSLKNAALAGATLLCLLWLLTTAFAQSRGQLRYSQGAWSWRSSQQGDALDGTLHLSLDLQRYVLVQFVPHTPVKQPFFVTNSSWLHLEAQHTDAASWLAFRRALTYSQRRSYEELAS